MQQIVQLVSSTGEIVNGLLCSMELRHLRDYYEVWHPILAATDQLDEGWPWEYKLRQAQQEERYEA